MNLKEWVLCDIYRKMGSDTPIRMTERDRWSGLHILYALKLY